MVHPVSIIVPAHNAATTLGDTLQSLLAQTFPHWEAIVIENGSTDATEAVASDWTARDPRIRLAHSEPGVSTARNTGIRLARHPWILFLDSDDWILPTHLERLTNRLAEDPGLDAAHCGWLRIGPDGTTLLEELGPTETDLFPRFARTCAITIHSCLTRRSLIQAAGGFDTTLRTCEDWDLWQRISRMGCRFGAVREALACYRTRPGSASMNAAQLISDSRKVIERGFSADPRVSSPCEEYAAGLAGGDKSSTLLYTVAWAAGLAIGGGVDATPLLDLVDIPAGVSLDPTGVAGCIHCCAMLPAALPVSAWADRFELVDPLLQRFLTALETRIKQPGLARSTHSRLATMALESATRPRPFTVGKIHAVRIEIVEPIPDLALPESVERLHCIVFAAGERLGVLELPVVDGAVPAAILADAIAAEFAWPILGRYLSKSVYPSLHAVKESDGWTVRRGEKPLASGISGNGVMSWTEAHDHIGWTILLQEVWGAPGLSSNDFYAASPDRSAPPASPAAGAVAGPWLPVELSEPLPKSWTIQDTTTVVLTVGGTPVAQTSFPGGPRTLSASAVRAALTTEAAFELCCACVREGLLGRPLDDPQPLRARLAERAARRRAESQSLEARVGFQFLPGATTSLRQGTPGGPRTVILARRAGPCGSSASRRALLPRALLSEIAAASERCGEPLVGLETSSEQPARIVYWPDLVWRPAGPAAAPLPSLKTGGAIGNENQAFDRTFFERLFQDSPNPWRYTTPYEQTKYEQTLAQLPRTHFRRALELACAEGHFTSMLAPHTDRLLATDVSETAIQRAAKRCRAHGHIEFARLDLLNDPLPGRFDLIVCSEALYYAGTLENLRGVAGRIARALEPGGYFVTAHAHLVADEPHRAGFDWDLPFGAKSISDVLRSVPTLCLVSELRTPLYRIQVYRRQPRLKTWLARTAPRRTLLPQPTDLPPHVAAHAMWRGGLPQRLQAAPAARTTALPILMYHHVAPTGPASGARYRVSPEAFEAQLRLLASHGFRSVSLDEWRRAMESRKPLTGRCIALTFDDGYHDFIDYAWPLLQRYGYSATIFLPTDYVAETNGWEQREGESFPLLSWEEIRRLRDEGVEFGSHTATHLALTSLSPTEIAREALRSRVELEKQLGAPVTSFAYPYGETDRVVEKVIGACGYIYGLTCEERPSGLHDRLTALPRLEVKGDMPLRDFEELLTEE